MSYRPTENSPADSDRAAGKVIPAPRSDHFSSGTEEEELGH